MNISDLKIAMPLLAKLKKTAMLHGEHGTGKSQVVRSTWEELGYKVADVRLGQMADAGDLIGLPQFMKDSNGADYLQYVFPDFFPRQEKTVIFFDELNRAPKDILQGVFEMVLDYSLKGVKLPKDTVIICAVNPATDDYSVLDFSDKAFQDRFVHIKFSPTEQEFYSYMGSKFKNSGLLAYVQEDPKMLKDSSLQSFSLDFVTPSRRSWEVAFRLEELYNNKEMDSSMFRELLMGVVGLAATTAGFSFMETHVGSIKGEDLIKLYHTPEIRNKLLGAKEKGRTDIVGTALEDLLSQLAELKGLEVQEGKNIINLVRDLTPEQQMKLLTGITSTAAVMECCSNAKGFEDQEDDSSKGLLASDELIAIFAKTSKARQEAQEETEKAKAKKSKKKTAEEA